MRRARRALIVAGLLVGCASSPPPPDRHARLLTLAAGEAGQIADADDRLRRQLNLAYDELDDNNRAEARGILSAAAQTLRSAKPGQLSPRTLIAGWVSISELSRQADDPATANGACDQAVATLRSLDPVALRPEYVVGVATEVRELRGKPAAAQLLTESVAWAREIPDVHHRRAGLREIADATFTCDDYAAGLAALRTDPDAGWRSDTLELLAMSAPSGTYDWVSGVGSGAVPGSVANGGFMKGLDLKSAKPFSQPVDYRSVFGTPRDGGSR